jgi:hypothetical protein
MSDPPSHLQRLRRSFIEPRVASPLHKEDCASALSFKLQRCVKRSPFYRVVHASLAGSKPFFPSDSWVEGEYAYVVFDLIDTTSNAILPPLVLFVIHLPRGEVIAARIINPNASATEASVTDLVSLIEGAVHGIPGRA